MSVRDPRPDELLEEAARVAWRHRLAVAWTDSLTGPGAKACSRGGSANWKRASPLPENEGAAIAYFCDRARKRNPATVAGPSGLVLVEADLHVADDAYPPLNEVKARVAALMRRLELRFPRSIVVRSRRGLHFYLRPPDGCVPAKVQLSEKGDDVSWISDGYTVGVPGLHELPRVVYEYVREGEIATLPAAVYRRLVELGGDTHAETRRRFAEGEPIPKGDRDVAVFWFAVDKLRDGLTQAAALERTLEAARAGCVPPLDEKLARKQFRGAVKWVAAHPTETELARAHARKILDERRARTEDAAGGVGGVGRESSRKTRALFLPFVDVNVAGPVRWLWRGKLPVGAVTLCAGRPKLGKSLLTIWLAAQLSRGLLEGAYLGGPAKTLLIAAEDPVDTIVKARLIAAAADESLIGTLASRPPRPPNKSSGLDGDSGAQDRQDRRQDPQTNFGGLGGLDGRGAFARRIVIPDEYGLLEEIVVENEIALLALDPINSFLSAKIDAHRDAEIRRVLDPLAALCARRHFAALAVVHLNRRTDTDVLNRITGSGGYGGSARSILTFGRHPENDLQRVVASEGNWQRETRSELFEIREVIVFPDVDPEDQTQPTLVHVGTTDLDSTDLVDQLNDDRAALDQAKEYLLGELALGPIPVTDLRRGAEANGISWRTMERAKKLLGVEARRISSLSAPRGSGRWEWFLELVEERTDEPEE